MPDRAPSRFRLPARELLLSIALVGAGATLLAWSAAGVDMASAVARGLSVLLVVSPFAPVVAEHVATRRRRRVLDELKVHPVSSAILDLAATADVVVFDTAGTLTAGTPLVVSVVPAASASAPEVLALAASAEFESSHPLARAVVAEARLRAVDVAPPTGFTTLEGRGVRSTVDGREVLVGSRRLLAEQGLRLEQPLETAAHAGAAGGMTVLFVIVGSTVIGVITIADELRAGAADAVRRLRAQRLRVAMLTGAPLEIADWLSVRLGLDEVYAGVLPADKPDVVSRLQQRGARVVVVGDGVDDAAALAQADVGVALGADAGETDIRIAARDPRLVADLLQVSRASRRGRRRRAGILIGYHAIAVPLAAGALAGIGVLMPPVLALALSLALLGVLALDANSLHRRRRP